MTPEPAQAIYFSGQQSVITHLCDLDAQLQASQQQVEGVVPANVRDRLTAG